MSIVSDIILSGIRRVLPGTPEHPPQIGPFPVQEDGTPGPPIAPPTYNAYTFTYSADDPSRLQYPANVPAVFHIVAAVDSHQPLDLDGEYEIEIRRKAPSA